MLYIYIRWHTTQLHKEWNPAICPTWLDLEDIRLGETNSVEKEKYHVISLIYGILKNEIKKLTDTEFRSAVIIGEGHWGVS